VWKLISSAPTRTRVWALGLACLLGWSMLTIVRGANASFERETRADIAASHYLFQHLVPGQGKTSIGVLQSVGFAGFEQVTRWELVPLDPTDCQVDKTQAADLDVEPCVLAHLPDYVLVTGSMEKIGVLADGEPVEWTRSLTDSLVAKGVYERVFTEGDAYVLRQVGL
jgi:hypothetical protein